MIVKKCKHAECAVFIESTSPMKVGGGISEVVASRGTTDYTCREQGWHEFCANCLLCQGFERPWQ